MKKFILSTAFIISALSIFSQTSFYDLKGKDINGAVFDFASLRGKKVMIVNTASKCGFTPQYADLEKLYEDYKSRDFVIIGFPANNFMNQEPGTDNDIQAFCQKNYGVSFPMMSKISVKGDDMHPVYRWLTSKKYNGVSDSEVKWNFQKYLIDESGKLVAVIPPKQKPDSQEVIDFLSDK